MKINRKKYVFLIITSTIIIQMLISCSQKNMTYTDLTTDMVQNIQNMDCNEMKTTLKELLNIDSGNKIYISYTQFHFPNGQWSNQKEFLRDIGLTVKNNEKLFFSDTLTSFFIINKNEVYEQYVVQSDIIKFSPDWYDPNIAYLAGVWNSNINTPSDSVNINSQEMEVVVFSSIEK